MTHTTKGQAHMAWASYIQKFPLPTLAHRTPNKADGEYRKVEGEADLDSSVPSEPPAGASEISVL